MSAENHFIIGIFTQLKPPEAGKFLHAFLSRATGEERWQAAGFSKSAQKKS